MTRINDKVELTSEERATAAATENPRAAMSILARLQAAKEDARKMGLLAKPVTVKGMTAREAVFHYAEDAELLKNSPEEAAKWVAIRDNKFIPVEGVIEMKQSALVEQILTKEVMVNEPKHTRQLEVEAAKLSTAEAKRLEAEAKLAAKSGANTAPKEELATLPGAGEIPTQDESPIETAATINADTVPATVADQIAEFNEQAERERLLAEASAGVPTSKSSKK